MVIGGVVCKDGIVGSFTDEGEYRSFRLKGGSRLVGGINKWREITVKFKGLCFVGA